MVVRRSTGDFRNRPPSLPRDIRYSATWVRAKILCPFNDDLSALVGFGKKNSIDQINAGKAGWTLLIRGGSPIHALLELAHILIIALDQIRHARVCIDLGDRVLDERGYLTSYLVGRLDDQ